MNRYIIKDWMNNTCFNGVEFDNFDDAWGYIHEHDPIPEPSEDNESGWYDDYYVVLINNKGE